jgi:hypothetical protein
MAISHHGNSTAQKVAGTSITFAFDVGTATDRVLVVAFSAQDSPSGDQTYAAVAMTFRVSSLAQTANNNLYSLDDPTINSNNVVITVGAAGQIQATATSYNGADTIGATTTSNGASSTPTITLTTTQNDSFMVHNVSENTATDDTPDVGTRLTVDDQGGIGHMVMHIQKATAGAQTVNWNNTVFWDACAIEVKEAVAAVNSSFLTFFGPQPQV